MGKSKFIQLELLRNEDLLNIQGESEVSDGLMYYLGYAAGWLSSRNWSGIPAHESALLGPNARPTY